MARGRDDVERMEIDRRHQDRTVHEIHIEADVTDDANEAEDEGTAKGKEKVTGEKRGDEDD